MSLSALAGAAHDAGLINENALEDVLSELLNGDALTLSSIARIFGVQVIYDLTAHQPLSREDHYRSAAIIGAASQLFEGTVLNAPSVVGFAASVVTELKTTGVLL